LDIPETVRIGSCDYAVELVNTALLNNNQACYGVIDFNNHAIRVNHALGDRQTSELAFLHELFHGIVHERGLDLENEELVVDELAKSLHQVIRDNPQMFRA